MKNKFRGFQTNIIRAGSAFLALGIMFFFASHLYSPRVAGASGLEALPPPPASAPRLQAAADETLPLPHLEEALERELRVQVQVTNRGSEVSRNINLEIPLLSALDSPYQLLLAERFSHQPAELSLLDLGSRTMTVQLPALAPGEEDLISMDYTLVTMVGQDGAALLESSVPEDFLAPSPKVESDHPRIQALAEQLAAGAPDNQEVVERIYVHVIEHMNYCTASPHRNEGALSALRHGEGVCEDYAALFVALARAAGIPARVVNGYADPAGTGEIFQLAPGEELSLRGYRHSWVEFYLEGQGWLPADPTFEKDSATLSHFGSLPAGDRIAQNYLDLSIRGRFSGGQLALAWNEQLVGLP